MGDIFLKLLNMSMTAGWLILAVLCIRFLFPKMPKWIRCVLWGIVAIRLIFPFSIESAFSLQPSAIQSTAIVEGKPIPYVPSIDSNFAIVEDTVNPILAETFASPEHTGSLQSMTDIAGFVWLCGMVLLLIFAVGSMVRLYRSVRESVRYHDNVYICDNVKSPFILGIVKPRIYISSTLNETEIRYVTVHEQAHLRRKDHIWKPLGYALLCVYWFHPLCWIAYMLLCKDIELACDEKVIQSMSFGDKKEYSRVLLSCATKRYIVLAYPLAFGEVGVKERVKTVLHYKKPAFWISVAAIMVCVVVAVCFLTNPVRNNETEPVHTDKSTDSTHLAEDLAMQDLAYYVELSASDLEFRDMSDERKKEILAEYGNLLDGYTLMSRESIDGETAYILGHYAGDITDSPLYSMNTIEYSGIGMTEYLQVLYLEENYEALDRILFTEGISAVSTEGHILQNSTLLWSETKDFILIQPNETSCVLSNTFLLYHTPGKGRGYVEDALLRGIALNTVAEPYLSVHMISEKYGEITENIPLTEDEAATMLSENKQELTEGFSAALNWNGEYTLYTEDTGVPQSILDLATEKCGYQFASPDNITDSIQEARLDCSWMSESILLDATHLPKLEEILKSAEFTYVGNCGYLAKLTLTLENGENLTVFKGADDCGSLVFGSFGGYSISDEANDEFWEMFGLDPDAEDRLNLAG